MPVAKLRDEPFGEGSTNRISWDICVSDAGEREYELFLFRSPAISASTDLANSLAD